eukprot:2698747-Pleurochrysis_carterae.AAC.1
MVPDAPPLEARPALAAIIANTYAPPPSNGKSVRSSATSHSAATGDGADNKGKLIGRNDARLIAFSCK